mgnify:CR=1 FL=1
MKKLTPIQAIRKKCLECQEKHYSWVRNCEIKDCSLYRFRLGRNPNYSGHMPKSDDSETGQIAE